MYSYIDTRNILYRVYLAQKNKIKVPEDQETLQVHQKNVAHVLVIFWINGRNGKTSEYFFQNSVAHCSILRKSACARY